MLWISISAITFGNDGTPTRLATRLAPRLASRLGCRAGFCPHRGVRQLYARGRGHADDAERGQPEAEAARTEAQLPACRADAPLRAAFGAGCGLPRTRPRTSGSARTRTRLICHGSTAPHDRH